MIKMHIRDIHEYARFVSVALIQNSQALHQSIGLLFRTGDFNETHFSKRVHYNVKKMLCYFCANRGKSTEL